MPRSGGGGKGPLYVIMTLLIVIVLVLLATNEFVGPLGAQSDGRLRKLELELEAVKQRLSAESVLGQVSQQQLQLPVASGVSPGLAKVVATPKPAEQSESVHWIFVTDCSAYMFTQGQLLLSSAFHVKQPGNFTWIVFGCSRPSQYEALATKLAHPRAQVFHAADQTLRHPDTGKEYAHFQASNRPVSIALWWKEVRPKEGSIGILDPDEFFMRRVLLKKNPGKPKETRGAWEAQAAQPGMGAGAMYGIGCVPTRIPDAALKDMCGGGEGTRRCMEGKKSPGTCHEKWSSGPPWLLHRDDAANVFKMWMGTAILVHQAWPDMLAEQGSYGITQMRYGVQNTLTRYWFLSNKGDQSQPWKEAAEVDWDPCEERTAPPPDLPLPPLWHACSTHEIPHLRNKGFRIHKDHVHKDILDCKQPLLHYPPKDALKRYKPGTIDWNDAWSVCVHTNLVNFHAAAWKQRFCDAPNLEPIFRYPPHAQGFVDASSWIAETFRKGGWTDVDYKIGRSQGQT